MVGSVAPFHATAEPETKARAVNRQRERRAAGTTTALGARLEITAGVAPEVPVMVKDKAPEMEPPGFETATLADPAV